MGPASPAAATGKTSGLVSRVAQQSFLLRRLTSLRLRGRKLKLVCRWKPPISPDNPARGVAPDTAVPDSEECLRHSTPAPLRRWSYNLNLIRSKLPVERTEIFCARTFASRLVAPVDPVP